MPAKAHLLEIEATLNNVIAQFSMPLPNMEKANMESVRDILLKLADIESKRGLVTHILKQNASWF